MVAVAKIATMGIFGALSKSSVSIRHAHTGTVPWH